MRGGKEFGWYEFCLEFASDGLGDRWVIYCLGFCNWFKKVFIKSIGPLFGYLGVELKLCVCFVLFIGK